MRWLRTPFLHFLAGGAALFWLVHGSSPPTAPVVVTARDVSRLCLDYTRETGLQPTPADEAALVEKAIEEELLVREALARGLDRNDRSVRNWLVEQMRVLSDDTTDDSDRLYARARVLGLDVTFWHVFLASSVHGSSTRSDAEGRLIRLRRQADGPKEGVRQGDSFSVPPHVIAESPSRLEQLFGAEVAMTVQRGETRTWIGPVPSPYGMHLVWIEAREPGTPPPFAAVRDRVLERWQDEDRTRRAAELLRDLARRYPLRVESAAWRQRGAS